MSVLEWRGGFPVVFSGTVSTAGVVTSSRGQSFAAGTPIILGANQQRMEQDGRKGPITSKWVRIANHGSGTQHIRVYFGQDHFDDNVHYALVEAASDGLSVWEGPAELKEIWLRAELDTPAFDITAFHRRG